MNSADIEKQIAELEAKERAQLEAGASDEDLEATGRALTIARKRLPVVREQEARAASEELEQRRAKVRPAAIAAAKEATFEHVFGPMLSTFERALTELCDEIKRVPEYRARLEAAQAKARPLTEEAGLAFKIDRADDQTLQNAIREVVRRALYAADLPQKAQEIMPSIYFANRSQLGGNF